MISKKIQDLKKDIYLSCYQGSPMAYIALQTYLEILGKNIFKRDLENDSEEKVNARWVCEKLFEKNSDYNMRNTFIQLNRKANIQKHDTETVDYDISLIKDVFNSLNVMMTMYCDNHNTLLLDISSLETDVYYTTKASQANVKDRKGIYKNLPGIAYKLDFDKYVAINVKVGEQGKFFYFSNIDKSKCKEEEFEDYDSIYSIIYNFLQRNSKAKINKYLKSIENSTSIKLNFERIFRYQMLILNLIRYKYAINGKLEINLVSGNINEMRIAIENIQNYAKALYSMSKGSINLLEIDISIKGIKVSYGKDINADIEIIEMVTENPKRSIRDNWTTPQLIYETCKEKHYDILLMFLEDFFNYSSFRTGQIEGIIAMLNLDLRGLCILPTGWGKSLIFYMNSLLSSGRTIVLAPTEILIEDQCRNLKELHEIDDVVHIRNDSNIDDIHFNSKLIFLTPATLQRKDVVYKLIDLNVALEISNVVLDEVHTICNWSHDFRPDYLMLTHNIFNYIDKSRILCFTATANYKVLNDIISQMKIDREEVFVPIIYKPDRYDYKFIECISTNDQFDKLLSNINDFIQKRELLDDKMIVFTSDLNQSKSLWNEFKDIGNYDMDCFDDEHTYSYQEFIEDRKNVLIADSELGIGLNLPKIKSVIHYGLPISKAQFVQEIGRASRDESKAYSKVIFRTRENMTIEEAMLFNLNVSVDDILPILQKSENKTDIIYTVERLFGHVESYAAATQGILQIINKIKCETSYVIVKFDLKDAKKVQKYLYVLRVIGYIDNWYTLSQGQEELTLQIEIDDLCEDLEYIKRKTIKYLVMMGHFPESAYKIRSSTSIESIIYEFQLWFYNEFLYYHREQLINVLEFFTGYVNENNASEISSALHNYFSISLINLDKDKKFLNNLSIEEIFTMNIAKYEELTSSVEELLVANYDPKLDLFLYLYQLSKNLNPQTARFIRFINSFSKNDLRVVLQNSKNYYGQLSQEDRLKIFNEFTRYFPVREVIDSLYSYNPKDIIYFGYLSGIANKKITEVLNV